MIIDMFQVIWYLYFLRIKFVYSYVLLAAELGGRAILDVNDEQKLYAFKKAEMDVGKAELLTKADLLSNQLIINVLKRYPGLKVRLILLDY